MNPQKRKVFLFPPYYPQRCKPLLGAKEARNSRKLHQRAEFRLEPVKIVQSIELESPGLSINMEQGQEWQGMTTRQTDNNTCLHDMLMNKYFAIPRAPGLKF